ncbi:MAG: YdcF family protein [Treponema sp.]|jgi:uncharacterized SAM-binding protein YcdF (DUF218 family)|nr:YdcF family protein [Treponema sp.]
MKFHFFKGHEKIHKNIIFTILGILFTAYFVAVSISWRRVDDFNKVMIFLGFLWIMLSLKIGKISGIAKKFPKILKLFLKISLLAFTLSFIIIECVIISNMRTTSTSEADYVIILGCQVDGSIPSIPLTRRVNAAVKYLNENQNTNVVISGGQGPGENISEAEAMKRILLRNGIDEARIFEENNAKNTLENFQFSSELYNLAEKNIIAISSDYHMFRALSIAKKLNYKNIKGLPCKSQLSALPVYLLREYAAVAYYMLSGRI